MYDFMLNKNGDILFKQSDRYKSSLQFDFFVTQTNGLIFDFYVDNPEPLSIIKEENVHPGFQFDFYIDEMKEDKEIVGVTNEEDYIYQQIQIRLNSALGTIKNNENIGSKLELHKHTLLNPKKDYDYSAVQQCVRDAIKDILPQAEITVSKSSTIYTDYSNSLIVTITYKELNYYYYL